MHIAIIGGGINGFSCALQILEHFKNSYQFPVEVVVIAENLTPNTTGDGSAGLWGPFLLGKTDPKSIYKWSKGTHQFLERIWLSEDAAEAGVCLLPMIRLAKNNATMDMFWHDIVYGYTSLTAEQLSSGVQFVTYTSEPMKLLPYLMKRFIKQGGKIVRRKVRDFQEFIQNTDYNVICNCTGLGATEISQDQEQVFPIRGQVSRIKANWIFNGILDESDDGHYIIPNVDSVVLGGTHQEHDYNTLVSLKDKNFIVNGCRNILPGIKNAQHLYDWVGLRPGRTQVRLETANQDGKIIIHNYGHGGSGVTLAWGCAENVLELVINAIQERQYVKSKL